MVLSDRDALICGEPHGSGVRSMWMWNLTNQIILFQKNVSRIAITRESDAIKIAGRSLSANSGFDQTGKLHRRQNKYTFPEERFFKKM